MDISEVCERPGVRGGRGGRAGRLLASLGLLASACGVTFDAPEISLIVRDDSIVYASADGPTMLTGGETVLRLANDGEAPHRIALAKLEAPVHDAEDLDPALRTATVARDDPRIIGLTMELDARETSFTGGGFGVRRDTASFHIYFDPEAYYVLYDVAGGLDHGVYLVLHGSPSSPKAED